MNKLSELAVLGGVPAFDRMLHVGAPNIGSRRRLFDRLGQVLDARWLTNRGPHVQAFERQIAALAGTRHAIAMCNATVALEIAIRALDLAGEVIVPSMTFVATAHSLQWQQITPVFCDIDPATHLIDPDAVEAMITPRTTGIIGVHLWGRVCDTERLQAVADRHGLALLYDAAHAFGCGRNGRPVGGFGRAEVFSFHATKFINAFEGGAVVTNDDRLAERIRLMQNFGFSGEDEVSYIGTNGKMNEASAAMGLTSLESMDEFLVHNRANFDAYRSGLGGIPGIRFLDHGPGDQTNYQYVIIEVDPAAAGLTRDQLLQVLRAENVRARRYFYPGCHRMEPYRSLFPHAGLMLPHTERIVQQVMALPTGTAVLPEDVEAVCNLVRMAVEHADRLRPHLAVGTTEPVLQRRLG